MSLDTSTVRKFDETKDLDLMERINAFKQEAEQAPESALSFHTKLENIKAEDRLEQNLDESDPYTEFAKKYDIAALATAASFGGAVPALIEALYRNMLATVEQNGEYSTTNGGGAIDPEAQTAEERKAKKQEEAKKVTGGDVEEFWEEQRELLLERQREEWAREKHSYAGVTLTGKEWGDLSDQLSKSSPLRDWLIDTIQKKDKLSATQAQAKADQIALLAKMQSLPKDQWTQEMIDLDKQLQDDPKLKEDLDGYLKDASIKKAELAGPDKKATAEISNTTQIEDSIDTRSDLFAIADDNAQTIKTSYASLAKDSGPELFASAPNLKEHHKMATSAKEPLDVQKPMQVAALSAPNPTMAGGLDL